MKQLNRIPRWIKWPIYFVIFVLAYIVSRDFEELMIGALYDIGGFWLAIGLPFVVAVTAVIVFLWRQYKKDMAEIEEEERLKREEAEKPKESVDE